MAGANKERVLSRQPCGRRRKGFDATSMRALDQFGDSVLVQLMKASGKYDDLLRLYQQPTKKGPDTCVSNRSGAC